MSDEWKERKLLGILDIFWDCTKKNLGDELVIAEYNGYKNQEKAIRANLQTYKKAHQKLRQLIQQKPEIDKGYVKKKAGEIHFYIGLKEGISIDICEEFISQIIDDVQGKK